MPKGIDISTLVLDQIDFNLSTGRNPTEIWANLFNSDPNKVSFSYLLKLCTLLRRPDNDPEKNHKLSGLNKLRRLGAPRVLQGIDNFDLLEIANNNRQLLLSHYANRINNYRRPGARPFRAATKRTISRSFKRLNWTRKIVDHRNMLASKEEGFLFLQFIAPFALNRFFCWDGMSAASDSFANKLGWGPRAERVIIPTFRLGGLFFSVLAGYGVNGFKCRMIKRGTMNSGDVVRFVNYYIVPTLEGREVSIFDNAAVNVTQEALQAINFAFNGLWRRLPAYSPWLHPIELGFSNIRSYCLIHDARAWVEPEVVLNEAFDLYSDTTNHGREAAFGNFSMYRRNHEYFLANGSM